MLVIWVVMCLCVCSVCGAYYHLTILEGPQKGIKVKHEDTKCTLTKLRPSLRFYLRLVRHRFKPQSWLPKPNFFPIIFFEASNSKYIIYVIVLLSSMWTAYIFPPTRFFCRCTSWPLFMKWERFNWFSPSEWGGVKFILQPNCMHKQMLSLFCPASHFLFVGQHIKRTCWNVISSYEQNENKMDFVRKCLQIC